jgi:hypothetical protein
MKRLRWLLAAGALAGVGLAPASILAQESGFKGFLHRAGTAVSQTAQAVVGSPAGSPQVSAGFPRGGTNGTTTNGPYYRPISPARGTFPGIFANYHPGLDTFPRVALAFTRFGASEPCWTVRATIWRSAKTSTIETFDLCNAPITAQDDLGNTATVDDGQGMTLANAILPAQNLEGSSHATSSPTRTDGPNPPLQLFAIQATGPNAFAFSVQYRNMLLRAAWLSGYLNPSAPTLNSTIGKSMWTRFEPSGNLDRTAPL